MTSLSGACELIVDCEHRTAPTAPEGYPLIRTPDIGVGRLNLETAQRVDEATYQEWTRRAKPQAGDLILAREAPVGNVGIIKPGAEPVLGQRTVLLRPRPEIVDPLFLNYLLCSPAIRGWMDGVASGATVPHLNLSDIRSMELPPLPPLPAQHKIAAILSAYDDLIENNKRRIKILEEMAQRIYREWFVHFRYPGHEGGRIVASDLGMIPDGWATRSFATLASYVNGFAFKPGDWCEEGLPIIKIRELKAGVTAATPRHPGPLDPKYEVRDGDLLFSWSADLDAYLWTGGSGWLNQHLFRVDPAPGIAKGFLFHALRDRMVAFRSLAQGTTMRHIKRAALEQVSVALPPEGVRSAFADIVDPIDALSLSLTKSIRSLSRTRDLLLPRLVSGAIDVTDLDIEVPEGA
jgi:type I restriction enzyme S subunit